MFLLVNSRLTFLFVPFISALSFAFLFCILQNHNIKIKSLTKIGQVSYSCYLLHFIFAWYLSGIFNKVISLHPVIMLIICYTASVILTYCASLIMYKLIELNGIKLGKVIIKNLNDKSTKEFKLRRFQGNQ
jgi:peptidoglycan/LPS O-acetylase OafA/YrhL